MLEISQRTMTQRQLLSLIKLLRKYNQGIETYMILDDDIRSGFVMHIVELSIPWYDSDQNVFSQIIRLLIIFCSLALPHSVNLFHHDIAYICIEYLAWT